MSRKKTDWLFRIHDMLKSIAQIEQVVAQTDFNGFRDNFIFSNSVIRDLEIIGEAAKHIPEDIFLSYPQIPWQDMRDMRNVLIHEYFGVNLRVVWDTVSYDLPMLKVALTDLLVRQGDKDGYDNT